MNRNLRTKNLLCLPGLALACTVAQAAWVADFQSPDFTVYLDAQRVVRAEQVARVPTLYDYGRAQTAPTGEKFQSVVLTSEVDCQGERLRLSALKFHAGRMGAGEVVRSENEESGWEPVGAENKATGLWKLACGR